MTEPPNAPNGSRRSSSSRRSGTRSASDVALGIRRPGGRRPGPVPHDPPPIQRRVFVDADPALVWAILHDPRFAATIAPELRLGPASAAWPAAGERRSGRLRLRMLREDALIESLEARPNSRFRYCVQAGPVHAEWTWSLERRSGGTIVVHSASGTVGDRLAGLLAGPAGDALATESDLRLTAAWMLPG